ncbi:MAG: glycosyltransferase family 2 protein, partial [Desulfovibrionaceae bacterium]
ERGGENGQEPAHIRRFSVSSMHHQVLDFGNFSYARPCVSATGCCHLFKRAALERIGNFDLRFSPSQYDDLEHDIRQALEGNLVVYQGHLQVRHMKRSGRAAWSDATQMMASWANLFKLQTRYSQQQFDGIREREHQALLADMLHRTEG